MGSNAFNTLPLLIRARQICVYPQLIKKQIPKQITIVDSVVLTAKYVKLFLIKHYLSNTNKQQKLSSEYYVSDKLEQFNKLASIFLNKSITNIKHVNLQ